MEHLRIFPIVINPSSLCLFEVDFLKCPVEKENQWKQFVGRRKFFFVAKEKLQMSLHVLTFFLYFIQSNYQLRLMFSYFKNAIYSWKNAIKSHQISSVVFGELMQRVQSTDKLKYTMNSGQSKVRFKLFHINVNIEHIQSVNSRCVESEDHSYMQLTSI